MNRIELKIFFIQLLLLAAILKLNGQEDILSPTGERVVLFTDRTLYIAGEQILFSASLISRAGTDQAELSRVLYGELITADGNKIAGNKYQIIGSSASGSLDIPNDITTGIYYLRAYTKFMRNNDPAYYHYTRIKIVNPDRSEIQGENNINYLSESHSGEEPQQKSGNSFIISPDKSQYATRDTVHISIDGTDSIQSSWKALSVAVIPEFSNSGSIVKFSENKPFKKRIFYYPEMRGLSITGKLVDSTSGKSMPHARVNLSILGQGRDFMAIQTDTTGRFFFSLPDYTGYRDLFLCSEKTISTNPKILVDNDFCTIPLHVLTNNFTLTQKERETAYNMAVNVQLGSYFKFGQISDTLNKQPEYQMFYGKPDEILYIDNYIQLPTLEEYLNELPTLVKVRKRQGEKYFKILGPHTGLSDFDPLILIDMVAIADPSKVLTISPSNILRIEVVNMIYIKGSQTYGGIVNIISKHGDFAGIDLPTSGIFINYGFLADHGHYQKNYPQSPHSPDTRNTLYWEPRLKLNKNNAVIVSFTTSDTPGKYLIILNGINSNDETFRQTSTIEVIK
jgi:hypothetical protein